MYTYRYLMDFDTNEIEKEFQDVVIIGSGIAGVYTALIISSEHKVVILTKETIDNSNSALAQGGIAVSLDKEDSPELHFKDTLFAGAGLCDEQSVWVLVNEAAKNIEYLCKCGVNFDKNSMHGLSLSREAAHSKNRIIHAGDTTGKEVCDKLICEVHKKSNVKIRERHFVVDVLVEDDRCVGVLIFDEDDQKYRIILSNIIICATGGFGQIYSNTTNPEVATGDGIALAYRAGADLMDMEFIQFHPTVLFHEENRHFLISEAVRGEGALLKNIKGERFMPDYHTLAELAPRDIVSRAIFEEMKRTDSQHVYLDITFKDKETIENRFPNIYKTCLEYGIDMSRDFIPVAPAEHYSMGGIRTDVFGRTNIRGFYACGESACTGIHGANRLASNSLLEGLVFGYKIGDEINGILSVSKKNDPINRLIIKIERQNGALSENAIRQDIQEIMTEYVGIIRSKEGLIKALELLVLHQKTILTMKNKSIRDFELQNILISAKLVVEAALEREESRGAHFRIDFDKPNDENWKRHIVKTVKY